MTSPSIYAKAVVEAGFTYQVHVEALKVAITAVRGGDPRTLKNWTRTLERLGFIKKLNQRVYKMNLDMVPELLNVMEVWSEKVDVSVRRIEAHLVTREANVIQIDRHHF